TRTASSAVSSGAPAIWPRMVCSRVERSVTGSISPFKGGWLWPPQGRKVKQKAADPDHGRRLARLNPFGPARRPRFVPTKNVYAPQSLAGRACGGLVARYPAGDRGRLSG